MTTDYQGGKTFDFFTGATQPDSSTTATKALRDFRNKLEIKDVNGADGKPVAGVKEVEIAIFNYAGGLNRIWGVARQPSPYYPYSDLDRVASNGGLLTDQYGVLSLQPLPASASSPQYSSNAYPMASTNFQQRLVWTAGNAMFKETSTTDPTPLAITYTPGTVMTYITTGIIGGAGANESMFIYKEGTVADTFSDLVTGGPTHTVMNAAVNPGWGHLNSPINAANPGATTLLIYMNGTISTLDSTQPVLTAPTAVLTSVPNGGYPIAIIKLPGVPFRAYWFFPFQSLAHSICNLKDNNGTNPGRIVSTQLDATDPQILRLPISRVLGACRFGDSIVFWDGLSIWQLTDSPRNMNIFSQRVPQNTSATNSDVQFQVLGCWEANGDLYTMVVENNFTNNTASFDIEKYVASTGAWHSVMIPSVPWTSGISAAPYLAGALYAYFAPGTYPFSAQTSFLQIPTPGSVTIGAQWGWVPPSNSIPFYMGNNTAGAGSTTGQIVEAAGNIISPAMTIEGLDGMPMVLEEIRCLGDIAAGGSDATVTVSVAEQSQTSSTFTFGSLTSTFRGNDPPSRMFDRDHYLDNDVWSTRFMYKVSIVQGSASTRRSPNALPLLFRFLVFTDGNPEMIKTPRQVRAGT